VAKQLFATIHIAPVRPLVAWFAGWAIAFGGFALGKTTAAAEVRKKEKQKRLDEDHEWRERQAAEGATRFLERNPTPERARLQINQLEWADVLASFIGGAFVGLLVLVPPAIVLAIVGVSVSELT
jgi:hypothetical protein